MQLTALLAGVLTLGVAAIAKATPSSWVRNIPVMPEEEGANDLTARLSRTHTDLLLANSRTPVDVKGE